MSRQLSLRTYVLALVGLLCTLLVSAPVQAIYTPQVMLAMDSTEIKMLQISPDGLFAVYLADLDTTGSYGLYSSSLDGTATTPTLLSTTPVTNGEIFEVVFTPDSSRVVYRGDILTDNVPELFSAPVDQAGQEVRLNDTLVTGGQVQDDFSVSPDSDRAIYRADAVTDNQIELYSALLDTPDDPTTLSTTTNTGGDVSRFQIAQDGSRVVYRGFITSTQTELFSAPLDQAGEQTTLSETTSGNVQDFTVAPDSSRVGYSGDLNNDGVVEVFSAPLDTAGQQLTLNDTPTTNGDVFNILMTPDSSRLVYSGDLDTDTQRAIYSAPLNAEDGQEMLSSTNDGASFGSSNPASYTMAVAPDSSRIVYRGDITTDGLDELYSAPLDQAAQEIKLNTSATGGAVFRFKISPDSSRVVYIGDLVTDTQQELFSAPLDAPGGQLQLHDAPVTGGNIVNNAHSFLIAPDSSRVVYRGDFTTNGTDELYSAPLDEAGAEITLNDDPASNGSVDSDEGSFFIAPDSSRAVYRGDLKNDGTNNQYDELYSAPLDLEDAQETLNSTPVTNGNVGEFAIAPNSAFAVYEGDIRVDSEFDVYASGVGQQPTGPITNVTAATVGDTSATIAWTNPAGGSQHTSTEVDTSPPPMTSRRATVSSTETSTTITGLNPSTEYTTTLVAVNDAGNSTPATVTFTTAAAGTVGPGGPGGEAGGVFRLSGDTRFDTAAAVALDRFDPADVDTVYLATGLNFPDALAGGPLAAHVGAPILLVEPNSLPGITSSTLATLAPSKVIALGGTVAIADAVLLQAGAAAGGAATSRLAGDTREATATVIADALIAAGGDGSRAFLAIGSNFPDAVAAGPATDSAPILLTPGTALSDVTRTWLATNKPGQVIAVGGEGVLAPGVVQSAVAAAGAATSSRLSGQNRYSTATAIAATLGTGSASPTTVYIAVGTNFPDALTGGPAASAEGAPIVLVEGAATTIPTETRTYIDALPGLRRIVILGGTGAIPDTIQTQLQALLDV